MKTGHVVTLYGWDNGYMGKITWTHKPFHMTTLVADCQPQTWTAEELATALRTGELPAEAHISEYKP